MTAGEEFDAVCEEIVQMMNRLQVRRRAFEEIESEEQWKLIGTLQFRRDGLREQIEEIDARLSDILDAKLKEEP